jgi:hypothetical protein
MLGSGGTLVFPSCQGCLRLPSFFGIIREAGALHDRWPVQNPRGDMSDSGMRFPAKSRVFRVGTLPGRLRGTVLE